MAADDGDESGGEALDPFEGLSLDDDFIQSAKVREDSAEDRIARLRRIDREHRELHAERERDRAKAGRSSKRRWPGSGRSATTSPSEPGRHTWRVVVVLVTVLGLFVYVTYFRHSSSSGSNAAAGGGGPSLFGGADGSAGVVRIAGGQPPAGLEEAVAPRGQPANSDATGPHAFIEMQADGTSPVAYDPCRPIHYAINPANSPADGSQLVTDAIARISTATGFEFVDDGATDEPPIVDRESYQPDRYGQRWAPVMISWSDPATIADLAGDVAGLGGSSVIPLPNGSVYVSGRLILDAPQLAEIESGPEGSAVVRAIIDHELGHVMGLQHVDDPSQIMYPSSNGSVTEFAGGDLEGLALLGRGKCFPKI